MDRSSSNGAKPFPHLVAAFFCEKLLKEADEVLSAIRIVDIIQIPPVPKNASKGILLPNLAFVMMIRAGNFRGKAVCEVYNVGPSGKKIKAAQQEVEFGESPEKGVTMVIPAAIKWEKPGLYWFEVYLNKRRMTRSPLLIKIMPVRPEAEGKMAERKKPKD